MKINDNEIMYLLSVATALQDGFLPYCDNVFKRCVSLVEQTLNQNVAYLQNQQQFDQPDKVILIKLINLSVKKKQ